jgi:hypothetical protein
VSSDSTRKVRFVNLWCNDNQAALSGLPRVRCTPPAHLSTPCIGGKMLTVDYALSDETTISLWAVLRSVVAL